MDFKIINNILINNTDQVRLSNGQEYYKDGYVQEIKYNKEDGHVYVHIYSKKDNMVIEVKDTGIGIPLADQGRVFERFYRVDKGRSRIKGGTGLGLAIVKHIVSYNKGTVKLHSQLGEGTCITITLPNKS